MRGLPAKPYQAIDLTYHRALKKTKAELLKRFYYLNRGQNPLGQKFFRSDRYYGWPDSTFRMYVMLGGFRISVVKNWNEDKHLTKLLYTDNFKETHWISSTFIKGNILKEAFITLQIRKLILLKSFKVLPDSAETLIPI